MQISPVAVNNSDLSTAVKVYQNEMRTDKASQTQGQQSKLDEKNSVAEKDSDASLQISKAGQEAYIENQKVASSSEADTDEDLTKKEDKDVMQFEEGTVRKISGGEQGTADEESVSQVAANNEESRNTAHNAAKLENFDITTMQDIA